MLMKLDADHLRCASLESPSTKDVPSLAPRQKPHVLIDFAQVGSYGGRIRVAAQNTTPQACSDAQSARIITSTQTCQVEHHLVELNIWRYFKVENGSRSLHGSSRSP